MLLQCKRLTSLAQWTVGYWRTTLWSFQHSAATTALGSLLVWCSLNTIVNFVFAGDGGRLVVADVAVKSFEFRVVAVYGPNCTGKRCSFFWRLGPFLDDPKRLVLMSDWNAILDPKIYKGGVASCSGRCKSSLINLLAEFGLVDRFRLDHSGREMWTWLGDFVICPTFHWLGQTDRKLVRVSLSLANRPATGSSIPPYWR